MIKYINVYKVSNLILVNANLYTQDGILIPDSESEVVAVDSCNRELGKAVARSLCKSRLIPNPVTWGAGSAQLLNDSGVRTWKSFSQQAKCVNVQLSVSYEIMPTRNGGMGGDDAGYHDIVSHAISLPGSASEEELGNAVFKSFSHCE